MMYKKALLFDDVTNAELILLHSSPKRIKQLGRGVVGFNESIWNEHKYEIVKQGNILKYSQNKSFLDLLLSTGDKILVEASPYDCIWGIGMGINTIGIDDPRNWKGRNLLGFALTEAKEILRGRGFI